MFKKKSLAVNSFYSVIYKLLNVLFPLVVSAYTARILLAEGIGKVAYAQNKVQYFVIIASLGIPNYGIREIAKRQENQIETNRLFSELFIINGCSTTICVIVYYVLVLFTSYFEESKLLNIIVGLTLILNYINVDWFYQGKEEYGYIATRNFLIKLISLILIFIFVKNQNDFIIYALINSIAIAGNNLLNVLHLRHKVKLVFSELRIDQHFKPILILLASSISIELYTLLDTTMLGAMCGEVVVGYYSNAVKVARIINSTISSIALVLLPRLSYYYAIGKVDELTSIANRVFKILFTLTLPASIGVFLLSNDIIPVLFGSSFEPAVLTLRILSILIVAVSLNNFFGTQILMTYEQETKLLISVISGAIINISLNSILIPLYAQNGAAVASAISEVVVLIVTFLFAKKYLIFKVNVGYIISLGIASIIMTGVVYLIKVIALPPILELLISFIAGVITYFLCGKLFKNESIDEIFIITRGLLNKIRK